MSLCSLVLAAALAATPPAGGAAPAGVPARHSLLLSAQHDEGEGQTGNTVSVTWMRRKDTGRVLLAGGERAEFADAHWYHARVGAAQRFGSKTTVGAELLAGQGKQAGRSFDSISARIDLSTSLVAGKLHLLSGLRHVDIDTSRGQLASLGLVGISPTLGVLRLESTHTLDGNLGTELFQLEWQRAVQQWRITLGFTDGRSSPQLFEVFDASTNRPIDLKNYLLKLGLPLADRAVDLIVSRLELGNSRRSSLAVLWRLPLQRAQRGKAAL